MIEKVLVTQEGYRKLLEQRQTLYDQLKNVQGQKGEAAETGGNAWHDNFAFEELVRQEMMVSAQIGEISKKIADVRMVEDPRTHETLQIGHVAIIELQEGEQRIYQVAGYGESDLDAQPPKLEYLAPIIRPFFAKEIGTETEITIAGVRHKAELVEIRKREDVNVSST